MIVVVQAAKCDKLAEACGASLYREKGLRPATLSYGILGVFGAEKRAPGPRSAKPFNSVAPVCSLKSNCCWMSTTQDHAASGVPEDHLGIRQPSLRLVIRFQALDLICVAHIIFTIALGATAVCENSSTRPGRLALSSADFLDEHGSKHGRGALTAFGGTPVANLACCLVGVDNVQLSSKPSLGARSFALAARTMQAGTSGRGPKR